MAKTATAEKGSGGKDVEPGTGRQELKRLLKLSVEEPVNVAFALDGNKAILLVDRRRPGRALEKELKESAPDSKNHRFGTAAAEPEAKMVRFTVNKASGGMARRLIVALKGTGFSKVELGSEDGAPHETHEEKDDTPEIADGHAAPAPHAAPDTGALVAKLTPLVRQMLTIIQSDPAQKATLAQLATAAQTSLRQAMLSLKPADLEKTASEIDAFEQAVQAAARAAPRPETAKADAQSQQQVTAMLTELAKQAMSMMQSDPQRAGPMKEHLIKAHAALKGGDLATATKHTGLLQELVDRFHGALAKAGVADGHGKVDLGHLYTAAAKQWDGIVRTAEADIAGVRDRFAKAFASHGAGPKITQHFDKSAGEARRGLLSGLAEKLRELGAAAEDKREQLVHEAAVLVRAQVEYVRSHPLLAVIDHNPVLPVAVKAALHAGLSEIGDLLSKHGK